MLAGCVAAGDGATDALPELVLSEEVRIGSVDDPDLGFSQIGPVDVDADGNLYVFEHQDRHIRVFDAQGRRIRTIGGPGQGPGEFGTNVRIGVVGDTLWAIDRGQRRITLFDRQGTVLSTARYESVLRPVARMTGLIQPRAMRADGTFTSDMRAFTYSPNLPPSTVADDDTVQVPRIIFAADGTVIDTLGFDPHVSGPPSDPQWVEVGAHRFNVPRAQREGPITEYFDEGRVTVRQPTPIASATATFTVTRVDESGDTVYHRTLDYAPQPFNEAVLDSLAMRSARVPGGAVRLGQGPPGVPPELDPDAVRARIRDAMDTPPFQVPVRVVWPGDDGSVWLRREDDGGPYRYLVLDREGRARGTIFLPRTAYPVWIAGDLVWAVERDELDVPWLVRYRIAR